MEDFEELIGCNGSMHVEELEEPQDKYQSKLSVKRCREGADKGLSKKQKVLGNNKFSEVAVIDTKYGNEEGFTSGHESFDNNFNQHGLCKFLPIEKEYFGMICNNNNEDHSDIDKIDDEFMNKTHSDCNDTENGWNSPTPASLPSCNASDCSSKLDELFTDEDSVCCVDMYNTTKAFANTEKDLSHLEFKTLIDSCFLQKEVPECKNVDTTNDTDECQILLVKRTNCANKVVKRERSIAPSKLNIPENDANDITILNEFQVPKTKLQKTDSSPKDDKMRMRLSAPVASLDLLNEHTINVIKDQKEPVGVLRVPNSDVTDLKHSTNDGNISSSTHTVSSRVDDNIVSVIDKFLLTELQALSGEEDVEVLHDNSTVEEVISDMDTFLSSDRGDNATAPTTPLQFLFNNSNSTSSCAPCEGLSFDESIYELQEFLPKSSPTQNVTEAKVNDSNSEYAEFLSSNETQPKPSVLETSTDCLDKEQQGTQSQLCLNLSTREVKSSEETLPIKSNKTVSAFKVLLDVGTETILELKKATESTDETAQDDNTSVKIIPAAEINKTGSESHNTASHHETVSAGDLLVCPRKVSSPDVNKADLDNKPEFTSETSAENSKLTDVNTEVNLETHSKPQSPEVSDKTCSEDKISQVTELSSAVSDNKNCEVRAEEGEGDNEHDGSSKVDVNGSDARSPGAGICRSPLLDEATHFIVVSALGDIDEAELSGAESGIGYQESNRPSSCLVDLDTTNFPEDDRTFVVLDQSTWSSSSYLSCDESPSKPVGLRSVVQVVERSGNVKADPGPSGENRTIRPEFEYISNDPQENADNFDPKWEVLRLINTDEERYKAIRNRWRNLSIPNPHVNLTYRHANNKGIAAANRKSEPGTSSGSAPAERGRNRTGGNRERSKSCTTLYEIMIDKLNKSCDDERQMLDEQQQLNMLQMNQFQQIEQQQVQAMALGNSYQRRITLQNIRQRQRQELEQMKNAYQTSVRQIEEKRRKEIQTYMTYMEEVRAFNSFYQGLGEKKEEQGNTLFLSEEQYEHLAETERMYAEFSKFYGFN